MQNTAQKKLVNISCSDTTWGSMGFDLAASLLLCLHPVVALLTCPPGSVFVFVTIKHFTMRTWASSLKESQNSAMYSHTVVFPRPVVISRDSFLINSSGTSIAVGFHKLPRSKKKKTKNQLDCSSSLFICYQIGGSPYLHQLILPEVQFYGFDLIGQAAVDARAAQTHKHTVLVGCPFWPWDV